MSLLTSPRIKTAYYVIVNTHGPPVGTYLATFMEATNMHANTTTSDQQRCTPLTSCPSANWNKSFLGAV